MAIPNTSELTCNSVAALVPAMQMHLLEATERSALPKTLAVHRLDLCMIALSELRDIYAGAGAVSELFDRAWKKLILQPDVDAMTEENRRWEQTLPSPSTSIGRNKTEDTTESLRVPLDPDFYSLNAANPFTMSMFTNEEWQQSWNSNFEAMDS